MRDIFTSIFIAALITVLLVISYTAGGYDAKRSPIPALMRSYNLNGRTITINGVSSVYSYEMYSDGCSMLNEHLTMTSGEVVNAVYENCDGMYALYTFDSNGLVWDF